MARRGFSRRRSPGEWSVRLLLAFGAAWLGYGAVSHAIAEVLRVRSPERAYALAPSNARIIAQLSATFVGLDASATNRARADKLARNALRLDPTALVAVTTLGIDAQLRGDTKRARRLFAYSQALSRRNLTTQLWMIEAAVARDDVPGTIRHYDIALRTSRSAPDLLWPVLASAISDPAIRVELVRTLIRRPAWSDNFIPYIAVHAPDALATADLLSQLRRARIPVASEANAAVISRLIVGKQYDAAWHFYSRANPAARRRTSRDAHFSMNIQTPSAFDWQTVNENGITSSIEPRQHGGLFDFAAAPSVGGAVLHQMQLLPSGSYQIEGNGIGIDQLLDAAPYWVLTCVDGRELGRVEIPNSANSERKFTGRFSVPKDCPAQTLSMFVRPSNRISGSTGQIDYVVLRPLP